MLTGLAALLASSCRPDELSGPAGGRYANLEVLSHEQIVLGNQLEDPYSLETMQNALQVLYPTTKAGSERLEVTDYYVRFLPVNETQFKLLKLMEVNLLDHPLDYEIIREGDYYHDPSIAAEDITWQYAVVPAGFQFPQDIRYEILDRCFIPDNTATKSPDIDWTAVEREAYRLSGNEKMLLPATKAGEEQDGRPRGSIVIVDDNYNGGEPIGVSGVMVSVNSFVKFSTAYTDPSGNYVIPKSYSSEIRYRLVFQNQKGFAIGVNLLLVPASVSTLGSGPAAGLNALITKECDKRLFSRCVANNAVYDYFVRCSGEDVSITPPPSNLRLWLFQNLSTSSAPMFQQGSFLEGKIIDEYLGEYKGIIARFLPDITIGLKGMDDYSSIYNIVQHELAHSSHFMRVGTSYWNKYIKHVITSFVTSGMRVYGVGTEPDSGYCEVGEMWAYYMQNVLYKERYGQYISELGTSYWFCPQILLHMDNRGITDSKIFTALRSTVTDRDKLQQALLELYPESKYIIDQAFNRYLN